MMALFEETFPPYVPFGSRTLRVQTPNLRGTDVAVFQAVYNLMLASMNPPEGPMGAPIPIDGIFGAPSQQACRNIQSFFGLAVDGIVGPDTYFVFGQGVGSLATYGGPVFGSRSLSPGTSGGDVTILQNRLNCFRYVHLLGHAANGTFDTATGQALRAFKADAVANGDTGLSLDTTAGDGTFDASFIYTFAGGRAIEAGRNGFDVVFLQAVLAKLGLYTGRITGYYDGATQAAVKAFQREAGISPDGVVGPSTFYHLGLRNDVAAPHPLKLAWPIEEVVPAPGGTSFTDCSTTLKAVWVPGGSVWVRQGPDGSATVAVTGVYLPAPRTFAAGYDRYWYVIEGELVRPMGLEFAALGVWTGIHQGTDVVIPFPPDARITISAGDSDGPKGPTVLTGSMADCEPGGGAMLT